MSEVKVWPVPEGSIVWLHDIAFVDEDLQRVHDEMLKAIGHDRFVMLCTDGGGIVEVLGPDELVARVRAALEPAPSAGYFSCGSTTTGFGERQLGCVLPDGHPEVMHEDPSGARWFEDEDGASIVESG